jgi:tRNA U34 5-methylaminomethyl-2-thiouridine-forming methyltransferase MnmC
MDVEVIQTKDGSHTLYSRQYDEIYHSRNGALGESNHVFILSGLEACESNTIHVFELGFGTGLNALLSWVYAEAKNIRVEYHSIELYPVSSELIQQINYPDLVGHRDKFLQLHAAAWDEAAMLSDHFTLHKINGSVMDFRFSAPAINVIFFDAFSPEKQPELWTVEAFIRMYDMLVPGGILVTYCSKSYVRRNMAQAGFTVSKLPGPPGKRDMVRAVRPAADSDNV